MENLVERYLREADVAYYKEMYLTEIERKVEYEHYYLQYQPRESPQSAGNS